MKKNINKLIVEWDDNKNRINKLKHGISFETAAMVFTDANLIEFYDYKHSNGEKRYVVIGLVNKLIVVIYTDRGKKIRIISARVATIKERRLHERKNSEKGNKKR